MSKNAQNQPIRILHLSDIHFTGGKAWDADPVLRALARYIEEEVRAGLSPDLVAITGDLAFFGTAEEYALARDWLERQFWPALPKNFPRDRLLLVPGNHDVDRTKVNFVAQAVQDALLAQGDQVKIAKVLSDVNQRNALLTRHAAYLQFLGDWLGEPQALPWWQRCIDIRGTRLHIAGLDSAFMACGDQDYGRLLLGRYQINQTVLAEDADTAAWRIALLHHPWGYLAEFDGHETRQLLHQHRDLLLRGHLHETQAERIVPPDPSRACLELAAGCVYENSRYPNAFQWIELAPEAKQVRVHFRTWSHNAWAIDRNQPACPDGVAEFSFGQRPRKPRRNSTAPLASQELADYRQAALSIHADIPLAGFKTKLRVPIALEELYVPLHAMLDLRGNGDVCFADADQAKAKLRESGSLEMPLIEAFREASQRKRRGLVILGDPGSGKTTHLKRLLLYCLKEGPAGLGLPADSLPVFLPLRELQDLTRGIDAFIEKTLDSPHLAMSQGFGKRLLERGHLLLLFDGLDEVADPQQRAKVARWIEQAARVRPNCTAVVTCRFAGYDDSDRLGAEFLELHLRPLSSEQADEFIRHWYRAVETGLAQHPAQGEITAAQRAGELIERLRQPDFRAARMATMTRNPLLLANLCLVHRDRGALPRNRHQLYEECIEVLLERWREAKVLPVSVPTELGKRVLQPAALWLHGEQGRTRATAAQLAPAMVPVLKTARWPGGDAEALLRAVRDESGLLTGWGPGQYGFMHLGFQEYLAAAELRRLAFEGDKAAVMGELAGHYGESWWQEVILLLLAQGNPSLFTPFMREALDQPGFDAAAELTGLILEEAAEVTPEPFEALLRRPAGDDAALAARQQALLPLVQRLLPAEQIPQIPPRIFAVDGQAAGSSRATGKAGALLTTANGGVELLLIPGGWFLMGSPDGVGNADERPQHEVEIQSFYLGRYPVTNEEYARFLQANPDATEPKYWGDRQFNQARQPVVGVSWEDACRFAAWAGGRLPSEAEWEYACRAGTQTAYWWGEDIGTNRANCDGSGSQWSGKQTSPVGSFAPNPFGLYDTSGNVWEWVQDRWYKNYIGAPADGSAWEVGDGVRRVVRGGSWHSRPAFLRAAACGGGFPDVGLNDDGFRLAQNL